MDFKNYRKTTIILSKNDSNSAHLSLSFSRKAISPWSCSHVFRKPRLERIAWSLNDESVDYEWRKVLGESLFYWGILCILCISKTWQDIWNSLSLHSRKVLEFKATTQLKNSQKHSLPDSLKLSQRLGQCRVLWSTFIQNLLSTLCCVFWVMSGAVGYRWKFRVSPLAIYGFGFAFFKIFNCIFITYFTSPLSAGDRYWNEPWF